MVVVIITLLATIFVANYREGEKQFALKRSAHQLAQAIRKAQELALSSQEYMGAYQGGYGICFKEAPEGQTGSYTLFIDCNRDGDFDESPFFCDDCRNGLCSDFPDQFSEKLSDGTLEKGIAISNLMPPPSPENNLLCLTFTPPDPEVDIVPEADSVLITLNFQGGPGKTIFVNKAGLIEIR